MFFQIEKVNLFQIEKVIQIEKVNLTVSLIMHDVKNKQLIFVGYP